MPNDQENTTGKTVAEPQGDNRTVTTAQPLGEQRPGKTTIQPKGEQRPGK
jgi:hypothetical protein